MAEFGIIENLTALHGINNPHEHDFKIEVVIEGKIDSETNYAAGVDHYKVIAETKLLIKELKGKYLREIFQKEGFKNSCNEGIAIYFISKLKGKFPVKYVKVWETEKIYAKVFAKELE